MRRPRTRLLAILLLAAAALASPAMIRADSAAVDVQLRVSPVQVALVVSATQAPANQPVQVRATVANAGTATVSRFVVELRVATDAVRIKSSRLQTVKALRPGEAKSVTWTICGKAPGNYLLLAQATVDGVSIDSQARLLTIVPGKKGGC